MGKTDNIDKVKS